MEDRNLPCQIQPVLRGDDLFLSHCSLCWNLLHQSKTSLLRFCLLPCQLLIQSMVGFLHSLNLKRKIFYGKMKSEFHLQFLIKRYTICTDKFEHVKMLKVVYGWTEIFQSRTMFFISRRNVFRASLGIDSASFCSLFCRNFLAVLFFLSALFPFLSGSILPVLVGSFVRSLFSCYHIVI